MNYLPEGSSLRDSIRIGLGDKWSRDIEDSLFWPISEFCEGVRKYAYEKGKQEELDALRKAGIIK